ncbi:g5083 [Coccomyxa elongata]
MATKYLSTGLLQPSCLGSLNASQVAQRCTPACGYTIRQPGLGNSEDECLEKLLQEVDQLRRAGNTRCAAKAFAEGAKLFTAALELKPDAIQLLINRAFARIMTAEPASADEDCCLALALKRRLPSAYRWRAAARRDCGWLAGALEDMHMAARMAPTADKKEAALKEVGKLEEWIEVLEESQAMKKAAEECRAREAKASVLAAEAKAAFGRILNERRADLARKKTEEEKFRKEQEAQRKQAEEDIRKQAHNQQVAKMLGKMQRSKNVEVLTVDPKNGTVTNGKGQSTDIDSFITFLRPQEARQASGSSTSGSQVPCSCETCRSAVRADSHSSPGHTLGTPSHAGSDAASSARHTMSAPVAVHSRLFPEPKQAQTTSAAQSTSQSTTVAVEEYSSEGDSDGKFASSHEVSNLDIKSTMYNLCGETVTPSEPALPFYFARRQPCAAGKVSAVPKSATLPDQAAVHAVLQEIAQKEHDARLELGVCTTSNSLGEAESCTESHDSAPSSTASAGAAKYPPTASAGTQENTPTVRTKETDRLAAMETEERKALKRPREEEQASDQLPRAQEQQLDVGGRADNTSARVHAVHAPSGPAHGISPGASSTADDTGDGCVPETDTVEYPAAQTDCAAAPVERMPAQSDPQSAASAAPESKQEPQPQPKAAMGENSGMPGSQQAEIVSATAAEVSAVPEETASEAAWLGNRSKSQKKKAKRMANLMSAEAAAPAKSPLDKDPSPSSEADTGAPTVAATKTSTGNADVVTCTPSEAATDSQSDDGAHGADGEESVKEAQSAAGQACPTLDSSKRARDGDTDAAAAPATNPAAQQAASSSEIPDNSANAADTTEAACEVAATLLGAASNRKAQEAEQTSASTTGTQQGRGLFSALGGWLGMGAKQGAASEASSPVAEMNFVSETTSGSATLGDGATSNPVSPSCHEGDYPGRDIYMKARAAHRQATERQATYASQDPTPHYRDLYREAMNLCDQALVVNPAIGQAYLTKAACCMHLDELQGAAEAYASALQHDLDYLHDITAHAHVDHILAAVNKEMACGIPKEDVVMGLLDAAVRLSRSAEWACQTRLAQGEAYLSFENKQMATNIMFSIFDDEPVRAAFMSSSKITPVQRETVSNLFKDEGNVLQKDKLWERAKSLYSLSISANPANAASWSNRAYMNIQLGLYGEAVKDATKVLDITTNTKLRDKAHRRRSVAYRELHQLEEAYTDLHDIKRKTGDDFHWIHCLELELVPFAMVQGDAPLVVTKEYLWVNELPAQKPTLDKSGGVMAGRWEPLMDDDAEAGCTKEQLLQRVGMSQMTAETTLATAKTVAPETSRSASPTGVASGPYSTSSQDSSPATAQRAVPSNGLSSPDAGPAAGQGPPSGTTAAGGNDGCGSRRPSSSYYTAEPESPLSDASLGSLLSEQR